MFLNFYGLRFLSTQFYLEVSHVCLFGLDFIFLTIIDFQRLLLLHFFYESTATKCATYSMIIRMQKKRLNFRISQLPDSALLYCLSFPYEVMCWRNFWWNFVIFFPSFGDDLWVLIIFMKNLEKMRVMHYFREFLWEFPNEFYSSVGRKGAKKTGKIINFWVIVICWTFIEDWKIDHVLSELFFLIKSKTRTYRDLKLKSKLRKQIKQKNRNRIIS